MNGVRRAAAFLVTIGCLSLHAPAQDAQQVRQQNWVKARAFWQAGDAKRQKNEYDKAQEFYEKAIEALDASGRRRFADVTRELTELCKGMPIDLRRLKPGTYTGTATGYVANITVAVKIEGGRIRTFEVTDQKESRPLNAFKVLPQAIVGKQSPSVDAVTGATVTSYAVMNATFKALDKARQDAQAAAAD